MLILIVMSSLYLNNGDRYKESMTKSGEAYYQGTEIKKQVDEFGQKQTQEHPILATAGSVAYLGFVKKQAQITTTKFSLVPDTKTIYKADNHSGSIAVVWSF